MDGPVKSFPQPIFSMSEPAIITALGVNTQTAGLRSLIFGYSWAVLNPCEKVRS
jgi:hypothetical protein